MFFSLGDCVMKSYLLRIREKELQMKIFIAIYCQRKKKLQIEAVFFVSRTIAR